MDEHDSFAIDFSDEPSRFGFISPSAPLIDPPIIRTYLASSLTNVDADAARDCEQARRVIKALLTKYDFLGVRFELYDPGEVTPPGTAHSPEEVYATDHRSTVDADLVIFHVNTPSLGVGMEAQISADATIPRVVIRKQSVAVSRMFRGVFSPTLANVEYENIEDLHDALIPHIASIAAAAIESAERRRPIAREFSTQQLGKKILKQRILHRMSIQELAKRSDILEYWLLNLERDPAVAATCSLMQLARVCSALDCSYHIEDATNLKMRSAKEEQLSADQKMSLDNLASFMQSKPAGASDDRVFRLWNEYVEQQHEQAAEAASFRASSGDDVVLPAEWSKRYDNLGLF